MTRLGNTERLRILVVLILVLLTHGSLTLCVFAPGTPAPPYETVIEPFEVLGPTGNRIYGQVRRPDPAFYPNVAFPAIILVPGGINPGRMEVHGADAKALAKEGMVVVAFNAEGRIDTLTPDDIRSEGTEDFNGFRHQDGLANLIEYVAGLEYVLADNIGYINTIEKAGGVVVSGICIQGFPYPQLKDPARRVAGRLETRHTRKRHHQRTLDPGISRTRRRRVERRTLPHYGHDLPGELPERPHLLRDMDVRTDDKQRPEKPRSP